jgi:hypothetical protein
MTSAAAFGPMPAGGGLGLSEENRGGGQLANAMIEVIHVRIG